MASVHVVKKPTHGEYIGRGSPLGNPFHLGHDGDRDQVVDAFDHYIHTILNDHTHPQRPQITKELNRLLDIARRKGHVNLQCFCAPKRCHGDVIKEILDELLTDGTWIT